MNAGQKTDQTMAKLEQLKGIFDECMVSVQDQPIITVEPDQVQMVAKKLRDHSALKYEMLLDLCCVDYLLYGVGEWEPELGTSQGYSRAQAEPMPEQSTWLGPRFVVNCHLLSVAHKERLRLKILLDDGLVMPTLSKIWPSSLWYEREAYDLFGVIFNGHPDLRRILTDYGFIGFPFRKDFPLVGEVEIRYDGQQEACLYEPVSIENRIGVPKVIRNDNRYEQRSNG